VARRQSRLAHLASELQRRFGVDAKAVVTDPATIEGGGAGHSRLIEYGGGRIVNVASIGAFLPRPGDAIYCATKTDLVTFSPALQAEQAGTGVQVQALRLVSAAVSSAAVSSMTAPPTRSTGWPTTFLACCGRWPTRGP
jgi:short-subunit dehydrogenase